MPLDRTKHLQYIEAILTASITTSIRWIVVPLQASTWLLVDDPQDQTVYIEQPPMREGVAFWDCYPSHRKIGCRIQTRSGVAHVLSRFNNTAKDELKVGPTGKGLSMLGLPQSSMFRT